MVISFKKPRDGVLKNNFVTQGIPHHTGWLQCLYPGGTGIRSHCVWKLLLLPVSKGLKKMEIIVFFLEGTVMKEKERGRMKEGGSKEREKGPVVWLSGLCRGPSAASLSSPDGTNRQIYSCLLMMSLPCQQVPVPTCLPSSSC